MSATLPVILLLFVGSGAAALIYEVVWFQVLQLALGSSAVSVGVLLATFMGGMCLGSLLLPRVISPRHHPLRVYAVLEIGIGVFGLLLLFLMPAVGSIYTAWGGYGFTGILLRGIAAAVCLLPPTLAMGATLPAVARWVETTPRGVSWLGFFYAGNIAGAVAGCMLAGFYLLRVYDTAVATYVAVALNVLVASIAWLLGGMTAAAPEASAHEDVTVPADSAPAAWTVYTAIALSGFCALAAQVIWTRQLALLLGATVYTFSNVLAVFLVGLGIGSSLGALIARTATRPREAFGWCQILIVGAMAWSAYQLNASLPYWPLNVEMTIDINRQFQVDLARSFWAVLPAPILWGASFPLAIAALVTSQRDSGRLVGGVYAANTLGAIVGALGASLLLVMWLGSQRAQQALMIVSALAGLIILVPGLLLEARSNGRMRLGAAIGVLAAAVISILLVQSVPPLPGMLVAYGRKMATMLESPPDVFYVGEGLNSSVAVSQFAENQVNYHNAGKIQASSLPQDMRLQRMLGHLTTLVPKTPKSVLVIGCGAGVTAGAVSVDPNVERVTIAEIEPLVPRVVSTYFGAYNHYVIDNPKVAVVLDDARHFLLTTDQKFDAITSDPLDPWVKGAAALYTREFFQLAKDRLNPGGVVTVFVQLYESSPAAVKSEVATFFEVFPNGLVFGNEYYGEGYDMVLLGQAQDAPINLDEMDARLTDPRFEVMRRSLTEVGFPTAAHLFGTFAGRAQDLGGWLSDASINYDRNLRLQYLAGLGLNQRSAGRIYADMLSHRKEAMNVFSGSEARLSQVRQLIETRGNDQ
jgi:spermidine synthase